MLGISITVLDALGVVLTFSVKVLQNQNIGFLLDNQIKKSK